MRGSSGNTYDENGLIKLVGNPTPDHDGISFKQTVLICLAIGAVIGLVIWFSIAASARSERRYQDRIAACAEAGGQAKYNSYNDYESCLLPPGAKLRETK